MSMTSAYATFANEGMLPTPVLIRRVETTGGEVLFTGGSAPQRVVSEATAYLMTDMMADVVSAGTAAGVRRVGFSQRAAGKTGTTNDYKDAWFIGYTPGLVTGVWVGYDMPRTIIANGYAAELAVPIWGRFMKAAVREEKGEKAQWFKRPKTVTTVTICRLSGRLATSDCRDAPVVDRDGYVTSGSMVYDEQFVRGTEPGSYCHLHERYESYEYRAASGESRQDAPRPTADAGPSRPVPPVATTGAPPVAAARADATSDARPAPPADERAEPATPAQRRGFWSRIFRRGGGDDSAKRAQPAPAPQAPAPAPAPAR